MGLAPMCSVAVPVQPSHRVNFSNNVRRSGNQRGLEEASQWI